MTSFSQSSASSILEPLPGESLSSWVFRSYDSLPSIESYNFWLQPETELAEHDELMPQKNFILTPYYDRDLVGSNPDAWALVKYHNVSDEWLEPFRFEPRPLVPFQFRQSSCYDCFTEALETTGQVAALLEWRFLLQPFCTRHGGLLRDGGCEHALLTNYSSELFGSHFTEGLNTSQSSLVDQYKLMCEYDDMSLAMGKKVQDRYLEIRDTASDIWQRTAIDNFILTLTRAVLMPCMHYSYRRIHFCQWAGQDSFALPSFYVQFYQEIYGAPSAARARALYLVGLLLGWVTEDEADQVDKQDYYVARKARDIWIKFEGSSHLSSYLILQLAMNQTEFLSIESLKSLPIRWQRYL
jgi:hypothetical protein